MVYEIEPGTQLAGTVIDSRSTEHYYCGGVCYIST